MQQPSLPSLRRVEVVNLDEGSGRKEKPTQQIKNCEEESAKMMTGSRIDEVDDDDQEEEESPPTAKSAPTPRPVNWAVAKATPPPKSAPRRMSLLVDPSASNSKKQKKTR